MILTHSLFAFLVLGFLTLSVIISFYKYIRKLVFHPSDKSFFRLTLIFSHIQILLGIVSLYFSKKYHMENIEFSDIMKNSELRRIIIEHPITMILATVFITIGWSRHKKRIYDQYKFKQIFVFYSIALLLVLSMIPWKSWTNFS